MRSWSISIGPHVPFLSVNLLTTVAQCDAIIAALDDRLRVITKCEGDFDYQRDNATDDATGVSARLTHPTSKIAELTTSLAAQTAGTDEHRRTDEELTDAQYEQKKLTFRQQDRGRCTWYCAKSMWTKPRAAAPASKLAAPP